MTFQRRILLIALLFYLNSCHGDSKNVSINTKSVHSRNAKGLSRSQGVALTRYKQLPDFVQHYLDSSHGKLAMADIGEDWNGSCVQSPDIPNFQFISGYLNQSQCVIAYKHGGIAPGMKYLLLEIDNQRVTDETVYNTMPLIDY